MHPGASMCASLPKRIHTPLQRNTAACASGECINRRERVATPSKSYPQSFQVRILPMSQSLSPTNSGPFSKSASWTGPKNSYQVIQHTGTKCNKQGLFATSSKKRTRGWHETKIFNPAKVWCLDATITQCAFWYLLHREVAHLMSYTLLNKT